MADLASVYSNPLELPFTPVKLRKLAVMGDRDGCLSAPNVYRTHELSKRLGSVKVEELVRRSRGGESIRSLARELGVANSALTRMLREQGVEVSKRKVSDDEATVLAAEYNAGATMAELEKRYGLSHGAVYRTLHRPGIRIRTTAPHERQLEMGSEPDATA